MAISTKNAVLAAFAAGTSVAFAGFYFSNALKVTPKQLEKPAIMSSLATGVTPVAQPKEDDNAKVLEDAKAKVLNSLTDPDSAKFRNLKLVHTKTDDLVCGEVNAKNGFGGYIGYRLFAVSPSGVVSIAAGDLERLVNTVYGPICKIE